MAPRPLAGAVLALDVDGVLLDPLRGGRGRWDVELEHRFGVDARDLQAAFFHRHWDDVAVGRRALEPVLASTLLELGWPMTAEDLIECWFEADHHVNQAVVDAAAVWHRSAPPWCSRPARSTGGPPS